MIIEKDKCIWDGDPILIPYKNEKTQYSFHLTAISIWGNPWDHTLQNNGFEVSSPEEAIDNFKKWLWGEEFTNILQKRRKCLLLNLPYLKGKKIAYDYKPYADVLVEAIGKDIKIPEIKNIVAVKNKKAKSIF